MGTNSWAGTQRGLADYGYTGPADGIPGKIFFSQIIFCLDFLFSFLLFSGGNTYKAEQRLASHYGYTGPIDGVLGGNSYKGIARYFNTL
jgi:hypothetical protein